MEPFRFHAYVCTQDKPDGMPCCSNDGAEAVVDKLKQELAERYMTGIVQVTTCGCLGLCEKGPNMVVYPEGIWYTGLTPEVIPDIIEGHFGNGPMVDELALKDVDAAHEEIKAHFNKVAGMKAIMAEAGAVPEELNRHLRGFMESRLVLSAVELDLFTAIGSGSTAAAAAKKSKADPRATEMLLNALAAIKLLEKEGKTFRNGAVAADYLVKGARHDSTEAILHPARLWHRWSTLTDAVKAGTSVAKDRGVRDDTQTRAFIAAMHRNAQFRAKMIVSQLDLEGVNNVLDLGGGSGAFTIAFLQQKSDLKATLFDVPTVVPLSREYIKSEKLTRRVSFIEGDMIADPLGDGYDLVWVSAICHMWGETENSELIKKVYNALNPGGQIIVQDFVLEGQKTSPRFGAVFALNMLVNTQSGSTYSQEEYRDWMKAAGFKDIELKPLPGPTDLVLGRK